MVSDDRVPSAPYVRGSATSKEAAESIADDLGRLQLTAFRFIERRGERGGTCDELEVETGMPHQTASARVRELFQRGSIADSGETRLTRTGRKAVVWVAAPAKPGDPSQMKLFVE